MPEMADNNAVSHETDVAIIGAGPVGLFAVFECGICLLYTSDAADE